MKRRFLCLLFLFLYQSRADGQTTELLFSVEITAATLEGLNITVNSSFMGGTAFGQTQSGPTVAAEVQCAAPYFFNGTECQRCTVCKRPNIIVAQLCTASTDTLCDTHCLSGAALLGGLCTMCAPGKYATLAECVACPVDYYSSTVGASICTPCAPNQSSGSGFTACVQVKKPSDKMALLYLCSNFFGLVDCVVIYSTLSPPSFAQLYHAYDQIVYFTFSVWCCRADVYIVVGNLLSHQHIGAHPLFGGQLL
jgi:hypothetical protein